MSLTIKKANNGYIISQGEDVDIIQTDGNPGTDKDATIDLLYVVAAWAGVITEENNDLFIAFDDESEEELEAAETADSEEDIA
tara:strand:+ start:123 stop:371 length:249 start_codon:yes stop_codon:yes gene_type:complete